MGSRGSRAFTCGRDFSEGFSGGMLEKNNCGHVIVYVVDLFCVPMCSSRNMMITSSVRYKHILEGPSYFILCKCWV